MDSSELAATHQALPSAITCKVCPLDPLVRPRAVLVAGSMSTCSRAPSDGLPAISAPTSPALAAAHADDDELKVRASLIVMVVVGALRLHCIEHANHLHREATPSPYCPRANCGMCT